MGHLRSNDRSINNYCTLVQDKNPPNSFTMNVAISFVVLALVACAHSAPAEKLAPEPSGMFEGDLDAIQGSLLDIKSAGEDLGVIEGKLKTLMDDKSKIQDAEGLLQAAVANTDLVAKESYV